MISNVLDLIIDTMVLIGALNQGETPNGSESSQVFSAINRRLDQWNGRRLNLYATSEQTFPLVAAQQAYQIGPSAADFNVPVRPFIQHARVTIGFNVQLPLELIGSSEWNAIEERGLTGNRPMKMWCDYGWPIATLRIWPVPASTASLILETWTQLTKFLALTDLLNFPPGYLQPFQFMLARDIAPSFQRQIDPTIVDSADKCERDIELLNSMLIRGAAPSPIPDQAPVPPNAIPMTQAMPTGQQ